MLDLLGAQYGSLRVLKELPKRVYPCGRSHRMYMCECVCGNTYSISQANLRSGAITHCGCASPRHGGYGTRLYSVWRGMVQRCTVPGFSQYKNYGARGICLYSPWLDFKTFRAWAETNGYADSLTLERKDNDGNYTPSNCVWIPLAEQAKNRRTNVRVRHNGEYYIAADLAKKLTVKYTTLLYRLRNNKPLEQ